MSEEAKKTEKDLSFEEFKKVVLNDFRIANQSRQTSLMGRKEVLTGKAKFGIFGDGKEVAQIAMSKVFKDGDFRSGYYRDQTFMMSIDALTLQQYFAGLYAHTNIDIEPMSAGRQMGGHFATHSLNADGSWKNLTKQKNSSSDISPTGSQMPRLLGLAYASYFYRKNTQLHIPEFEKFSLKGNEVAFGTIGDASTSEGIFWETLNAAGVLQIPLLLSVWDDGYGISVPKKYQTTKASISDALKGFQRENGGTGFEIFKTKGWDYAHLCETYEKAIKVCREEHVPVLVHVEEVTQPQGHSTSGSHERYKSKERLQFEQDFDCIKKMRDWMIENALATAKECDEIEEASKVAVREAKSSAWNAYLSEIKSEVAKTNFIIDEVISSSTSGEAIQKIKAELSTIAEPNRKDLHTTIKKIIRLIRNENFPSKQSLIQLLKDLNADCYDRYSSHLYSETSDSALKVKPVDLEYAAEEKFCDAREILRDNFEVILSNHPEVLIFGEDSGKIGGVNQGLEGLQGKFSDHRVFDTGIREATIMGQAIGLALRGLRPIAEIQYLDYLLYALQIMSDDLATLQYRTKGRQKAPVIIRTRGHRLEGVWHSGSPMGMIISACRGINVCVPRNMTIAAGFYNTFMKSDEPALIVEPLNGYRLKERVPTNLGKFCLPIGIPEVMQEGNDVTLVTYGSCVRIAQETIKFLAEAGISVELVDVQTLIPFDIHHKIVESVKKTNRLVVLDEDVVGGASAFILQQILEKQQAYQYLDSAPLTISAKDHRPAYGTDGDYFSKPSADDVFDVVYNLMSEYKPNEFPKIY